MRIILLTLLVFQLVGCDAFSSTSLIERAKALGRDYADCSVNQVLPNQCQSIKNEKYRLELELKSLGNSSGIDKAQLNAAFDLGKREIFDFREDTQSVYSSVTLAHMWSPKHTDFMLSDMNYEIFTTKCSKYSNTSFYQRYATVNTTGIKNNSFIYQNDVVFYKLDGSCFDISDLQDKFIILSADQINRYSSLPSIKIHTFDSFDLAQVATQSLSKESE